MVESPLHALRLAERLQQLGRTYELVVYGGDDHILSRNREERDRRAAAWFQRFAIKKPQALDTTNLGPASAGLLTMKLEGLNGQRVGAADGTSRIAAREEFRLASNSLLIRAARHSVRRPAKPPGHPGSREWACLPATRASFPWLETL